MNPYRAPFASATLTFTVTMAFAFCRGSSAQVEFRYLASTPGPCGLWGNAVADFDGDGHLDAASPAWGVDTLCVFRGRGDGTFHAAVGYAVGDEPWESATADLDGDGDADVAVSNHGGASVSVLLNDGAGAFGLAQSWPVGDEPTGIVATDLDGDARVDLAVTNLSGVAILFGDGAGGFAPARSYPVGSPGASTGLAPGDFNEDGLTDLAIGGFDGQVLLADGAGGFELRPGRFHFYWPVSADLNHDGRLDLVTIVADTIYVWRSDGLGGFDQLWLWEIAGGVYPLSTAIADFDKDGLEDIFTACLTWSGGGALAVVLTDADAGRRWWSYWYDDAVAAAMPGDFDEDSAPDVLLAADCEIVTLANRTFEWIDLLKGNVNATAGAITPVLFVNGSPGTGSLAPLDLSPVDPLTIALSAPPSRPHARFVLYAWHLGYSYYDVPYGFLPLPYDLGACALPTPLIPRKNPQPRRIANNLGYSSLLGADNWPGPIPAPAPTVLLDLPSGFGRDARLFFQGFIVDSAAPNGQVAITNGIDVRVQ